MDSEFRDLGILGVSGNATSDDSDQFPDLSLFPDGETQYRPLRNAGPRSVSLKPGASPLHRPLAGGETVSTAAEIIEEVQVELRDALLTSLTHSDTGTTHSRTDHDTQAQPSHSSLSSPQGSAPSLPVPALLRARLLQGVHGHLHAVDEEDDARLGDLPSLLCALGLSHAHTPSATCDTFLTSSSDTQQRAELRSEQNQEQVLEEHIAGSASGDSGLCPTHHLPNPCSREESEAQLQEAEAARRTLPNTEGLQDGVQRALEAVLAEIQRSA